MSLSTPDVARFLLALALLIVASHFVGSLFVRMRQPRVVGEILGGLILGPTVLGLLPSVEKYLFPSAGTTAVVLGAISQLGLLLLLFCSGTQIRTRFRGGETRTVGSAFITGMIIPFVVGLGMVGLVGERQYFGPHGNHTSFLLVFCISMAVTSIPVISKIMFDLGLMGTRFSRIVLGVAVVEDVVLYVVLAVALGAVGTNQGALFGLPKALGIVPGGAADLAYHCVATLGFLALFTILGPPVYRRLAVSRLNLVSRYSPLAFQLITMLVCCLASAFLGVEVFFGAFVAGIVVARAAMTSPAASPIGELNAIETKQAADSIRRFSFGFFIPVYFAVVGLGLDLRHGFPFLFFVIFLGVACLVKAASVYLGARLSGEPSRMAVHLSVAMNARGGPGIVIASTAFAAGIVDRGFYGALVLLAVITSLVAGAWLDRVPREEFTSTDEDAPAGQELAAQR